MILKNLLLISLYINIILLLKVVFFLYNILKLCFTKNYKAVSSNYLNLGFNTIIINSVSLLSEKKYFISFYNYLGFSLLN